MADVCFSYKKNECLLTFWKREDAKSCLKKGRFLVFNKEIKSKEPSEFVLPIGKLYFDYTEVTFTPLNNKQREDLSSLPLTKISETPFFVPKKFLLENKDFADKYCLMLKVHEDESNLICL